MWPITDTIEIKPAPGPQIEVMLDNFRPHPGFKYVGRTVYIRTLQGTEYQSQVLETRQHPDTWSFVLPLSPLVAQPGSFFRFLSHGILVE